MIFRWKWRTRLLCLLTHWGQMLRLVHPLRRSLSLLTSAQTLRYLLCRLCRHHLRSCHLASRRSSYVLSRTMIFPDTGILLSAMIWFHVWVRCHAPAILSHLWILSCTMILPSRV